MRDLTFRAAALKSIIMSMLLSIVCLSNASAQNDNIELTYNISSNTIYSPGDQVLVNIYSYSYDEKTKNLKSIPFNFTIYKIKNVQEFYSKQTSKYSIDVLGSDSTN